MEWNDFFMYDDYGFDHDGCAMGCGTVTGIILAILLGILFSGCAPKVMETVVVTTDTCYVERNRRDSIYIHDSTYIHEYQRKDTLIIERVRWHTHWRDRIIRDTAYISKRDTVIVAGEEQRAPLTEWQVVQMWMGRLVMIALAVLSMWFVVRWQLRHNWP